MHVRRCLRCSHQFVWPLPSDAELASIYDDRYYRGGRGSVGFSDYGSLAAARRRMFRRHLDQLERLTRRGRLLDVGCATGDFLRVAIDRGWDGSGVDPSPARDEAIAAGLPIVGRTLEDAVLTPNSLDVVTFWDVLEHLPEPVEVLRQTRGLLRSGGLVAATVPNSGSAVARVSGRRWFGYKTAGEHLQFFRPRTLAAAFRGAGFTVLVQRPVAWSCTVGFVADRAALYLGPLGALVNRVLRGSPLGGVVIDVPQVNQLIVAQRSDAAGSAAA